MAKMKLEFIGNSKEDKLVFLHISPSKNREGILKKGLITEVPNSGYGEKPTHKAVYLYVQSNISVIYDMMNIFEEFDIYEVYLKENDKVKFMPDEDSGENTWQESLKKYGTIAYGGKINREDIELIATITSKNKRSNSRPNGTTYYAKDIDRIAN